MTDSRRRLVTLAVIGLVAVPLAVAATAFACARLATLKLDRATARMGTLITATGRNYNSSATSSPVQIRFNGRNGRVLWEGRPDSQGRFRATFVMPPARRGHYVILGTQALANGAPAPGTPGRAPIRVKRRRASSTVVAAPLAGGPGAGPAGPAPIAIGGIALLVALAGGGLGLGLRRRGEVPTATQVS